MAVIVTLNKSSNTLEFRPEAPADDPLAVYLYRLVREAKNTPRPGETIREGA